MKNLRNLINQFYKHYCPANTKLSRADMHSHTALMTAYEDMWLAMDECGDMLTAKEYSWLLALYNELGDYIAEMPAPVYRWHSATMGNIVQTFGEVITQALDSLIHYHTIDIRWHYCRKGY